MLEEQIENKVIKLVKTAKENMQKGLNNTIYSDKVDEILSDYTEFLKSGIASGLINCKNIDIYTLKEVVYDEKGNAYASWSWGKLTLMPRLFLERNDEEKRNVIFHELIHSLMEDLIKFNNYSNNFSNFCRKVTDYLDQEQINFILEKFKDIIELSTYYVNKPENLACEMKDFMNEATTQNLAEILVAQSLNKSREEYKSFKSKILTDDSILVSNFAIYPEYQQIFNYFLRTINGLGTIENDKELFFEYFKMLQSGTIWQQIIGTYLEKEKTFDLFDFIITMSVLRKVKEKSMGINVTYDGDKYKLTYLLNSLCEKMKQLRNTDEIKNYPYIEFPKPETIKVSFGFGSKK